MASPSNENSETPMPYPIVFFCRCRPQDSDAIELVRTTNRAFIGYPAWREGKFLQDHNFRSAMVDLSSVDQDKISLASRLDNGYRGQIALNRNLVREAGDGSIVLVPRPARGLVYAGRTCGFELVDNPSWGADYLSSRREQQKETEPRGSHLADVVQGWRIDRWREIPFAAIPAWIRGSLLGRSTIGRISPIHLGTLQLNPFKELDCIIERPDRICPPETSDLEEIQRRLITDIGPSSFEHLVVALLQLERPEEVWMHVGGSGDGGVDGLGTNRNGEVVALLQCKWRHEGGELPFERDSEVGPTKKRFVATLVHRTDLNQAGNTTLLDRLTIARLVLKHAHSLPWAKSMQINN
jgi:hypothetical protein